MFPQKAIPAVYMRGGTSRALFFHAHDLPSGADARAEWDALFCDALGSPDPYQRQLDGMGGGISSLSKIAVIAASTHARADIDYTFAQVDVTRAVVGYRANCGNISSAVGAFAVDEGLVEVGAGDTTAAVVIHNTNTGKLIRATFPVVNGRAAVRGALAIDGVAGTGAAVELAFLEPGGAATGKLLPTGNLRDRLEIPGLGSIEASLVDACNPTVFVDAAVLGMSGLETPAQLSGDPRLLGLFEGIRIAAAVAMGLVENEEQARTAMTNLPLVGILSRPVVQSGITGSANITTRMISSGQPHKATPLTGALCLAVAVQLEGTIASDLCTGVDPAGQPSVVIEHASGKLQVAARVTRTDAGYVAHEAIVFRTARRLMEGRVLVPA